MLERIYRGRVYPAFLAVLITVGHIFAVELYTNVLICAAASVGFFTQRSARHFMLPFCAYTYQISVRYAPGMPSYSSVNFSGVRGAVTALALALLLVSAVVFVARIRTRISVSRLPILIPSGMFGAALLLNGAFGGEWLFCSFIFGAVTAVSLIAVPYFFYVGLEGENTDEIISYFIYVTALIAWVLVLQTLELYLSGSALGASGAPVKENVLYGWGIWTTGGMALAVLIPVLVLGAMREKAPAFYSVTAVAALVFSVLNLSRAALLVAAVSTVASLAVGCAVGRRKRAFRITCGVGTVVALGLFMMLYAQIAALLRDYIDRGLSDNGRFDLWRYGLGKFLEAPVFGKGFFALQTDTFQAIGFLPQMLHNTFVQVAASMGLVGLAAYAFYRVKTAELVFLRPTAEKTMLGISMAALLLGSMLDNFIFYIQPTFYYSVAFALAMKSDEFSKKYPPLKKLSVIRKNLQKNY